MSSRSQNSSAWVTVTRLAMIAALCSIGMLAAAQDQPAPKVEIFGGYSFFYPGADVHVLLPGGVLPVASRLESNPRGVGASLTYNFNRWFGLTGDISGHWGSGETGLPDRIDDAAFYNLSAGPKITFRSHYFSPFLEALVGEHRLTPDAFHRDDEIGFMVGGGLDLNLGRHFALRLLRADYVFSNHQFGPDASVPSTDVRGARLQSGVVFLLGGGPPPVPPTATCSAQPAEVMAGEPVTVNTTANNFNPKHRLSYNWNSTGGKISGNDSAATVDTNGLAAGSYTATVRVTDSKGSKNSEASCSASFAVKEMPKNPPTASCTADPSSVQSGTPSNIACTCTSPDNASVALGNWTASSGTVSGNGGTATLNTSGASPGPITVSVACTDSRGLNAQATAQVMVENPPTVSPEVQALEGRLALHSIYFPTAQPTVLKPEGGLLASQQQTLLSLASDFTKYLQAKPEAHLILEGHADPRASVEYNQALSERRVERAKNFLIEHGVPAGSIETKAFGQQQNLTADQVKEAVENSPELTAAGKQRVLRNMTTILLASNRRVDITLSTTGQQSVRQYPFNAADSLTLLRQERTKKSSSPAVPKEAKP